MKIIWENITWKKILVATMFFGAMYYLINFSAIGVYGLNQLTDGVGILDLEVGYTPEFTYDLFARLGQEGRQFYLYRIIPLDFLFPLSYMFFFSMTMAYFFQKNFSKSHFIQKVRWVPVLTALFDYLENIMIIILLTRYPIEVYSLVYIADIFTRVKFFLLFCSVFLLIIGAVIFIINSIKNIIWRVNDDSK